MNEGRRFYFVVFREWPVFKYPCVTCVCLRLSLSLLLLQTLAVHRNAAVAVQLLALGGRRLVLVGRAVVGSLLVLLTAVPPELKEVMRGRKNKQKMR